MRRHVSGLPLVHDCRLVEHVLLFSEELIHLTRLPFFIAGLTLNGPICDLRCSQMPRASQNHDTEPQEDLHPAS